MIKPLKLGTSGFFSYPEEAELTPSSEPWSRSE